MFEDRFSINRWRLNLRALIALGLAGFSFGIAAEPLDSGQTRAFINDMVRRHHFDRAALTAAFNQASLQTGVIERMSKPAEGKPWFEYRRIFITETRIQAGLAFWRTHVAELSQVERDTGVPPEILLGILGVETTYGQNTGNFRVLEALATLAFHYPKRAAFFRQELEQFLLLCRQEGQAFDAPLGSYAGAMGLPQFMPSSFMRYAADFDGDGRRDIWRNAGDALASIARYFRASGWRPGEAVAYPVSVERPEALWMAMELPPKHSLGELRRLGVNAPADVSDHTAVTLLDLPSVDSPRYWIALHNFYVITRYNHSPLYAMAVHELGQAIKAQRPE